MNIFKKLKKLFIKPKGRFEIFKDKKGEWRFSLVSPNNEIVATSEGYLSKQGALNGIRVVKKIAKRARTVEVQE